MPLTEIYDDCCIERQEGALFMVKHDIGEKHITFIRGLVNPRTLQIQQEKIRYLDCLNYFPSSHHIMSIMGYYLENLSGLSNGQG